MNAVLGNAQHPEYGVLTLPFPIPEKEYGRCLEMLEAIGIGSVTKQDCKVIEIHSDYEVLRRLEGNLVNVDELDCLAKLLGTFTEGQDVKFEAMAYRMNLHDVRDFINLTLCCEKTTVITDFRDLNSVGKDLFLTLNGGSASTEEFEALDGTKLARQLIASGTGVLTPYGVVFDNGMEFKQEYTGGVFPGCLYEPKVLSIELYSPSEGCEPTFLSLPMPKEQLERMLERGGFAEGDEFSIRFGPELPSQGIVDVLTAMDEDCADVDTVRNLNWMSAAIERLSQSDRAKLDAVVKFVGPELPFQIQYLAENLKDFEFAPGVKNSEDYGRYMIQKSGEYQFDPNLEPWYDYRKYGDDHIAWHEGQFTEDGYVAYCGTLSMDELKMELPEIQREDSGMEMGGMA